MFDTLFSNADILTMEKSRPILHGGFVGVKNGMIAYISEEKPEESAKRTIDCTKKVLMPGLINTHAHTAMCVMRGYADDYPLQQWLYDHVFPVEARLDERAVVAGARLGFAEMLRTGTTSVSDMYYFQPAVAELALNVGIRASLSNGVIALDPDQFDYENDRSMRETRALISDFHGAGSGRIKADVSIHGEYTSAPKNWRYVTELGKKHGLNMHVHLSETRQEHDECVSRCGKTPAQRFAENGVFDLKTIAAHCVWITEDDMELMAKYHVSCAHSPVSNLKLGSGIAPIKRMKEKGVNVSLGTDGCCSNNTHDLFEEIKLSALLSKGTTLDPTAVSAYEALEFATVNGARAQGRENEVGKIARGMEADIILVDLNSPLTRPYYSPDSAVVFSATGERVCLTMVQGKVLYENGEFTTIDIEKAYDEVEQYALKLVLNI
jgi:5-methylthioadenosine/S-adenosylhomocysteine deaminase